jgi:hypothetical protein
MYPGVCVCAVTELPDMTCCWAGSTFVGLHRLENLGIRRIYLPIKSLYYNDLSYKLCVLMESSHSGEQIDTKVSILEILVVWWSQVEKFLDAIFSRVRNGRTFGNHSSYCGHPAGHSETWVAICYLLRSLQGRGSYLAQKPALDAATLTHVSPSR